MEVLNRLVAKATPKDELSADANRLRPRSPSP